MNELSTLLSILLVTSIAATVLLSCNAVSGQTDTTFTYQGELNENGSPVTDVCDFVFRLYDSLIDGNELILAITEPNVNVSEGRFAVELDYGAFVFDNSNRWLQIEVRCPAGKGGYTILNPRQPITRSPYSIQTRGIFVGVNENVGIGTTSAFAKLHVAGDNAALRLSDTSNANGFTQIEDIQPTQLRISKTNPSGDVFFDMSPIPADGTSNAFVRFFRYTDTDGIKAVRFLRGTNSFAPSASIGVDGEDSYFQVHGGNVGIGTTTPFWDLDVNGTVNAVSYIAEGGFILDHPSPSLFSSIIESQNHLNIGNYSAGDIKLNTTAVAGNPGAARVTIKDDGKVGVGTQEPAFLLHVDGSAGKPSGGPWSSTSDIRLKKNIKPLDGALKKLLRLRGVTFEYIDPDAIHELTGERIGMIAQEVETVIPDWVDVREDGYKTVTQRGFEALTVEALRELREEKDDEIRKLRAEKDSQIASHAKRFADLERVNTKTRAENDALHSRLDSLESVVEQIVFTRKEQE